MRIATKHTDSSLHILCFCHSKWRSVNDIHDRTDCLTRPSQKVYTEKEILLAAKTVTETIGYQAKEKQLEVILNHPNSNCIYIPMYKSCIKCSPDHYSEKQMGGPPD